MRALFVAGLLLLSPVLAQETPCTEADPCPIPVDMDEASLDFGGESTYTVTAGDWFVFDAFNIDGPDHDILIADLGIEFVAAGLDGSGPESSHGPYAMDVPGTFTVTDATSGATATLVVTESDVAQGRETKDSPGVGLFALVGLLALGALRRR